MAKFMFYTVYECNQWFAHHHLLPPCVCSWLESYGEAASPNVNNLEGQIFDLVPPKQGNRPDLALKQLFSQLSNYLLRF